MAHRLEHGFLGHCIEHDAIDALVLQNALAFQDLEDVPRDRFALAVRVGRENHAVGVLDGGGDVGEALAGLAIDLPQHRKIIVGIDRAVLGGQVADMAEGRVDVVVVAQIFVDCLGLGRRFDDHDLHAKYPRTRAAPGLLGLRRPTQMMLPG